jgi:hypothetical protein
VPAANEWHGHQYILKTKKGLAKLNVKFYVYEEGARFKEYYDGQAT